ncbi:MAG: hypothetical protein KKC79_06020 [Gammaproteobacteria bacterium]|nr:hypothetical protein [Gammaproteobacteria bacterium]MBU1441804.1 hypothetical protein [Gammaproteobacteria bacterium]MBU2408192.1 hypothetical protein [Gammaproteobacteria bacterium]
MSFSIVRRSAFVMTFVVPLLLSACTTPPKPTPAPVVAPAPPPPAVRPVEAEPIAPATQPAFLFTRLTEGPVAAVLEYADKIRGFSNADLSAELGRLGDPGDSPLSQMQTALVLAQTRVPADLVRALGLLQRVNASSSSEALPLKPLSRVLAARYVEQRRVEEDRDRQAQQVRESQKRIDQLSDRLEALRAIERSFSRPGNRVPAPAAAPAPSAVPNGTRPSP